MSQHFVLDRERCEFCTNCGAQATRLTAATIYGEYTAYWCPRCGTLIEDGGPDSPSPISIHTPGLVDVVRRMADAPAG